MDELKRIRVLLIEDNPGDARLVKEALNEAGRNLFTLDWVSDLASGLAELGKNPPDVILLDLTLPDSDGLDTFRKVHTNAEMVPTILLTGVDDSALALKILQQGGQDYLIKGEVSGRLLTRVIHYSIERKQAEKAIRQLAAIVESADDAVISKTTEGLI